MGEGTVVAKSEDIGPNPLKVELLCWGLETSIKDKGRRGGAGPAGGRYIEIEGDVVNVPMRSVKTSPLRLRGVGAGLEIVRSKPGGKKSWRVKLLSDPSYYSEITSSGISMKKVALLHGRDCLATTLYQSCSLKDRCRFCTIDSSFRAGDALLWKSPHDLVEVAKGCPQAKHWTITSGYHPILQEKLVEALRVLKGNDKRPIHVQVSPDEDLETLRDAGADTLGIHMETLDEGVMEKVCPGKFAIGYDRFIQSLESGVEIYGDGQVSTFIILGLGEDRKKTLDGMERLVREGIVPFLTPFRPLFTSIGLEAPDPFYMYDFYEKLADMFRQYGLDPRKSRAGCVRCGACWGL